MSFLYQAFGLTLQAGRPIPGLHPATDKKAAADVFIDFEKSTLKNHSHLSKSLWYESSKDQMGQFLCVWRLGDDQYFHFLYSDGTRFLIDSSGKHVTASWPDILTFEDMATYLIGPILGFVLRLHGVVCLHASAIVVNGFAIAILSPAGYGKSTTAAAFAKRGYPVLSDDVVALIDHGDIFWVQPAFPRLHLWPPSVKALFGQDDALPRITPENPFWDKRYLDLCRNNYRFQSSPMKLAAVYNGKHSDAKDIPHLDTLSAHEGFIALIANTYSSRLLDKKMRALEFDVLSRLAASVPVKCLKSQKDLVDPHKTCNIILDDARRLLASINSPEHEKQ